MIKGTHIRDLRSRRFAAYVKAYRIYQFNQSSSLSLNPEGNIELVFQLSGDFYQRSLDKVIAEKRPQKFIGGLHSKAFEIQNPHSNSQLISIIFSPLGARHFIPESLVRFKNSVVDLGDVLPELNQLSLHGMSDQQLVAELDVALHQSYRAYETGALEEATLLLQRSSGMLSISEICKRLKISRSYLRRIFGERVGMSPKEYAKILRVGEATKLLKNSSFDSLTGIAYDLGYYDQAHFIKEFKAVTNFTPSQFIRI